MRTISGAISLASGIRHPVTVAVALLVSAALGASACGDGSTERKAPQPSARTPVEVPASANEVEHFASMEQMLVGADLVILARVSGAEAGRTVGGRTGTATASESRAGEDDLTATGGLRLNAARLEVERVLHRGRNAGIQANPESVVIEEPVLGDPSRSGLSAVGDRGVYFLHRKADSPDGAFRLVSSQGRFLDSSEGVVHNDGDADWARALDGVSLEDLVAVVVEAAGRAASDR